MKRILSLLFSVTLILLSANAFMEVEQNEEAEKGFWGSAWNSIGDAAKEAWGTASDFVDETLDSATDFAEETWDSASDYAEIAWELTEEYAYEIFGKASDAAIKAWMWSDAYIEECRHIIESWIYSFSSDELDVLYEAYVITTNNLNVDSFTADRIWEYAMQYAEDYDIDKIDIAKLTLATITNVVYEEGNTSDLSIRVIEYIHKGGIDNQETANFAIRMLEKGLSMYFDWIENELIEWYIEW